MLQLWLNSSRGARPVMELSNAWFRVRSYHFGLPSLMPTNRLRLRLASDAVDSTPGSWRKRHSSASTRIKVV